MSNTREDDFKRNNSFSLYDLYGNTLAHEPLPRSNDIFNVGRLFAGWLLLSYT